MRKLITVGHHGTDIPPNTKPQIRAQLNNCKKIGEHVYGPDGYSEWHDWARRMGSNYRQEQCDCGFFVLWIIK